MTTIAAGFRAALSTVRRLARRRRGSFHSSHPIMPEKTGMIERVFREFGLRSFADLGGVWGVEGGYTFFSLENFAIDRAFLVDTDISATVEARQKEFPRLQLIKDNFGSEAVAARIGKVDAVYLFDTLLHQVSPDWDEVIRIYAEHTDHFLVFNQQYTGPKTVRLFDLGEDEYFRNVPHERTEEPYATVFEKMYEIHPQHGRIYRDIHNVWQWGIADEDLRAVMEKAGFREIYYRNHGGWPDLERIENRSFIFKRVGDSAAD